MPAADWTPIDDLLAEAQRQVAICNGCRYCEGYCAVFPAMERLPLLDEGGLAYLANLCHDCRACFQACMYAPPHSFGVEIPRLLSTARRWSYERYARPRALARAFDAGPRGTAALTAAGFVVYLLIVWIGGKAARLTEHDTTPRSFYHVVPYALMAAPAMVVSVFVLAAIWWGVRAFVAEAVPSRLGRRAWLLAAREAATLRWLDGGGGDCYYPASEAPSKQRRLLHHLVAYGFGLAFASTSLAALYQDALNDPPPYPLTHPVVIIGLVGGLAMTVGATGLIFAKRRAARLGSLREMSLNQTFLIALDSAASSGLLLLALRGTSAMGVLLVVHLATLAALYLAAPYGKAVHVVYRFAALLRSAATRIAEEQLAASTSQLAFPLAESPGGQPETL